MRNKAKPIFKYYNNKQMMLLPPSLDELIAANHPVRVVDRVIDEINIDPILEKYIGGGTSSYDPRMLLKVLIYAYLCNIYSSRKIESSLSENIHFMWLSGMSQPDHNTINRFRSDRLKDVLKETFSQVVMLLANSGQLSLKEIYIDGTKIEANANRYSFVWGKAIKYNEKRISQQLQELWDYSQQITADELKDDSVTDFTQIDSSKVKETIDKIDSALANKSVDKKIKQKLNYAKKNWSKNMDKYNSQKEILGNRNSFSKTDTDATFMRMKEDHMRNGQLKPGYNLQISTNNQFIVNYSLHHNPTDTTTLMPHLEEYKRLYKTFPEIVTADAGYGSEENYVKLEESKIDAYVKYSYFDKETKLKKTSDFKYDKEKDCYYCPAGQVLVPLSSHKRTTETGYKQHYIKYGLANCQNCALRNQCCKSFSNRTVDRNAHLILLREKAAAKLNSEKGIYHRKKRCIEAEPVFANIKHNKGFKRFMLRGIMKTEVETGLVALAHNIAKMAA